MLICINFVLNNKSKKKQIYMFKKLQKTKIKNTKNVTNIFKNLKYRKKQSSLTTGNFSLKR